MSEENASDKWSVSGSRKWKFGGYILWILEIRGYNGGKCKVYFMHVCVQYRDNMRHVYIV